MPGLNKRNNNLDIYRALLCVAVLFYHLGILKGGYLAVCGFFVISGFLTAKSLAEKAVPSDASFIEGAEAAEAGRITGRREGLRSSRRKEARRFFLNNLSAHYLSRLRRIYLPLLCTCLITLAAVSLMKDLIWISLKPETLSVLFGYNNFWQISANLDYFARHTQSPFMHFWYMGILLQFELVYPLVFPVISRKKPALASGLLAAAGLLCFIYFNAEKTSMEIYYNTFSRCFSLLFGAFAYFLSKRKAFTVPKIFHVSIVLLCVVLFIAVDASSFFFEAAMIIVSVISCIICACPAAEGDNPERFLGRHGKKQAGAAVLIAGFICSASYEIYLVQYPVIYIYQHICGDTDASDSPALLIRAVIVTAASIVLSVFIKYSLRLPDILKKKSVKPAAFRVVCGMLCLALCAAGAVKLISEKDHTKEMAELEAQLLLEEEAMKKRQEEQALKMAEEKAAFDARLKELNDSEEGLKELARTAPVTAIGDSVMLGAAGTLSSAMPNCYCDAAVSRTIYVVPRIIEALVTQGSIGDIVVFHLGTNGDGPEHLKDDLMTLLEGKEVFWLSITNDTSGYNEKLEKFTEKYDNAHFVDWNALSKDHPEYFRSDRIHLTAEGKTGYTQVVSDAIYNMYLERFNAEKNEFLKKAEQQKASSYTLAGDELLASLLKEDAFTAEYPSHLLICENDLSCRGIYEELKKADEEGTLSSHIVIALYSDAAEASDYEALIRDFSGSGYNAVGSETSGGEASGYETPGGGTKRDFLFITLKDGDDIAEAAEAVFGNASGTAASGLYAADNVRIIDFSEEAEQNRGYLHADRLHLTEDGLDALLDKVL